MDEIEVLIPPQEKPDPSLVRKLPRRAEATLGEVIRPAPTKRAAFDNVRHPALINVQAVTLEGGPPDDDNIVR
jgi:hypothetical protein